MPLSLTRRVWERVVLTLPDGRTLTVRLTDIDRGRVRLAFDAPQDVRIEREELRERRLAGVRPPDALAADLPVIDAGD